MPKVDTAAPAVTVKVDPKALKQQEKDSARQREAAQRTRRKEKGGAAGGLSLHDLMMQEATAATSATASGNSLRDEDVGHGATQQLTEIVKSKERADPAVAENTVFRVQQTSASRVLVTEVEEAMAAMTALD